MTNTRQWIRVAAGTTVVLAGLLMALAYLSDLRARMVAAEAVRRHPGGELEALLAAMDDGRLPMRERNRAVWALGQLGESRALEALRGHVTGLRCDHERRLCEAELRKAVRKLEGDRMLNPPWRWGRVH